MTKKTGDDEPTRIESVDEHIETKILTPDQHAYKTIKVSDPAAQANPPFDPFSRTATIGEYRIIRQIGEGGMGVVYEAEQQNPHRLVALKVIRGGLHTDDTHVKMFEREIEALARLKHPGIASIYESGRSDDGQVFFAMELVNGIALSDFVEKRRSMSGNSAPDTNEQLELFAQIGDVVSHAHQRGVIHRDLKPQNVLVTGEAPGADTLSGEKFGVKILDFGLARINDPDFRGNTGVSQVGQIKGTLLYMSPEQVRGRSDEIDVRSDVYSLGVMLYEMLSGQMPYDLEGVSLPEAMRIICEEPPKPVSAAMSATYGRSTRIDRDVQTIALKALEKEPDRRYQSVAAMLDDIERYLNNQPITARPPSAYYQFRKLVARHKAAFASMAAIFLLLLGFGVVMAAQSVRIANERDRALNAEQIAEERKIEAELARNDEQKQRLIAEENLDRALTEERRAQDEKTKAENALKAEAKQRKIADDSLREVNEQKAVAQSQTKIAERQKSLADQRAIEANDQKTLAMSQAEANRRQLYVSHMNLAAQAWERADVPRMTELLENYRSGAGQPDLRGFEWHYLWRLSHNELWSFTRTDSAAMFSSGMSPDGKIIFLNSVEAGGMAKSPHTKLNTILLNARSGEKIDRFDGIHCLRFATNDKLLTVNVNDEVRLLDPITKESAAAPIAKTGLATFLAKPVFSPDGKRLIVFSPIPGPTLEVMDFDTGKKVFAMKVTDNLDASLMYLSLTARFHPSGKILATPNKDVVKLWSIDSGKEIGEFKNNARVFSIAFSSAGALLASATIDGTVKLWDVGAKKETAVLRAGGGTFNQGIAIPYLEFSPDGKTLAVVSGRAVRLWDVNTMTEMPSIRTNAEMISSVSFSPDGKRLVTVSALGVVQAWGIPHEDSTTIPEHAGAAISNDGKLLATISEDGIHFLDYRGRREIAAIPLPRKDRHGTTLGTLYPQFSADGSKLAVLRIRIRGMSSGDGIVSYMGPMAGTEGAQVELYDVGGLRKIGDIGGTSSLGFTFVGDGMRLATHGFGEVTVWETETLREIFSFKKVPGAALDRVAATPDGKMIAVARGSTLHVIDTFTGQEITSPIEIKSGTLAMVFSPDGKNLARTLDKDVELFDFINRKQIALLKGHSSMVMHVSYSPDGRRLATVSTDGFIKIWDVDTRQELVSIKGSNLPVVFSPDGKALITTSEKGVHIWGEH